MLALSGYAMLVGAGAYLIGELASDSAKTAAVAIDVAITQSAEVAIGANETDWALPRALRSGSKIEVGAAVDSTSFPHARPAPRIVEQVEAEQLAQMKQQVSERVSEEGSAPWFSGETQTYRTMCVRLCDGAYFQVSYSTTRDRFQHDETVCAARCGAPTKLFVQRNPGGSPETMQDRSGRSYMVLPTAFQFRREAVSGCSCRAEAWEQASKDRHRLYALEQQQAEGRVVDVAELSRLRRQVTTAAASPVEVAVLSSASASEGTQQPATVSVHEPARGNGNQPAAPTSAPLPGTPTSAPITTAALPTSGSVLDADLILTQRDSAAVGTPAGSQVRGEAAALKKTGDRRVKNAKSSMSRKSENPNKTAPTKIMEPTGDANSDVVVVGDTAAKIETTGKFAKLSKSDRAGKQTAPGAARVEQAQRRLPLHVVEKPIWGVGRNARHVPRGNSAFDTFARNFY